jgi:hypothetical protein
MCNKNTLENDAHKVENKNKTIENDSDFVPKTSDESDHVSRYENAVIQLTKSACELLGVWESIPRHLEEKITHNQTYPFGMSFDELVYEIVQWNFNVKNTIENWRKENAIKETKES